MHQLIIKNINDRFIELTLTEIEDNYIRLYIPLHEGDLQLSFGNLDMFKNLHDFVRIPFDNVNLFFEEKNGKKVLVKNKESKIHFANVSRDVGLLRGYLLQYINTPKDKTPDSVKFSTYMFSLYKSVVEKVKLEHPNL